MWPELLLPVRDYADPAPPNVYVYLSRVGRRKDGDLCHRQDCDDDDFDKVAD